jgi:hypothetical protein
MMFVLCLLFFVIIRKYSFTFFASSAMLRRYAGVAEITQTNPIWKSRLVIARKSEIGSEKLEAKTESNITLTKN